MSLRFRSFPPADCAASVAPTPIAAVLVVTFFESLGTGIFWNAIPFIAKHGYDFSQNRNLLLAGVMGIVYTIGAFRAGQLMRWARRWLEPRSLLALIILAQAIFCLAPISFHGEWALWLCCAGVSYASAIIWPLVESYLTAGRHGAEMRQTIGRFNFVWMLAVALPLVLMGPILEDYARWAIGAQAVGSTIALIPLLWFAAAPGHHDLTLATASVSAEYPMLLRSARVLLPLSYVLLAAMNPLLPYRLESIGVTVQWETPATATWMIVRVLVMLVMWHAGFWHGRWGTLLLAAMLMTGGFATVVLAPKVGVILAGFAAFGAGMGMVYYAALYYAMSVGRAEVDAGGVHEALIGSGYAIGPAAGLAGAAIGGPPAIVGIVWGIIAVGALGAVAPYRVAVKRRRGTSSRSAS